MRFSRKTLGIPYAVFLLLFVVAPLLVLFFYAFTNGQGQFTLRNLTDFFTDPNTLGTLFYSFALALTTTALCLILAYPTAYILTTGRFKKNTVERYRKDQGERTDAGAAPGLFQGQPCEGGDRPGPGQEELRQARQHREEGPEERLRAQL